MTHAVDVPQWQPTERDIADARVTDFARFVQQRTGTSMTDYHVAVAVVGRRPGRVLGRAVGVLRAR